MMALLFRSWKVSLKARLIASGTLKLTVAMHAVLSWIVEDFNNSLGPSGTGVNQESDRHRSLRAGGEIDQWLGRSALHDFQRHPSRLFDQNRRIGDQEPGAWGQDLVKSLGEPQRYVDPIEPMGGA